MEAMKTTYIITYILANKLVKETNELYNREGMLIKL